MPVLAANPYNYNPTPQGGSGAFGAVPGPVSLPNPAGALASQYPDLSKTNTALSGDILSKLGGQLSPATIQQLQNASATFGVNNGMPGANATPGALPYSMNLESLGLNSEQQQQQGIQDYNATIPTVSGTQTLNPALEAQIAQENALNAAAPNPAASESYAESLYNQYLNQFKKGGGTGSMTVTQPRPSAAPTTTVTPALYSPLAATSTGGGSYYNGQWFPAGTGPTANLTAPGGDTFGGSGDTPPPGTSQAIDPVTGLPVSQYDPYSGLGIPPNLDFASAGQ